MSLRDLTTYRNLDEDISRAWWLQCLHPAGPRCPRCKSSVVDSRVATWRSGGRVRCVCGRHFTARTGTAAQGMTANWRQLTVLTILAFRGCRIDVIAAACDLSDNTIRQYLKRLRA